MTDKEQDKKEAERRQAKRLVARPDEVQAIFGPALRGAAAKKAAGILPPKPLK